MNIVINGVLAFGQPRGVGRYLNDLLSSLADQDKENNYYIYYGKWMSGYSFLKIDQQNLNFIELDISNNQIIRNLYLAIILPFASKKYKPDVFFLIDTQAIIVKPCKIVSTIHDIAEFQTKEKYSKIHAKIRRKIVRHQVRLSDYIITDSKYSQKDICSIFNRKENEVEVIYIATKMKSDEIIVEPENYFLFVSETERAKNLMELIEAFDQLKEEYKSRFCIKVVGKKGNDFNNIVTRMQGYNMEDKVQFYGYVSDEELNDLYKKAYAFVFPSFFEGFGLPILEAMAKGTPVLCSNSSSLPEVGGKAVLTFDPYKSDDLCDKLTRIIENPQLRDGMIKLGLERAKEFSFEKTARQTLSVLKKGI